MLSGSVFQIERGLSELITTREIPSNLPVDVASIQSLKNPLRKSVAYCEICKSAVNATIELRKSGASDEVIGSLLEMFCVVFYKSYEEICRREVHAGYLVKSTEFSSIYNLDKTIICRIHFCLSSITSKI